MKYPTTLDGDDLNQAEARVARHPLVCAIFRYATLIKAENTKSNEKMTHSAHFLRLWVLKCSFSPSEKITYNGYDFAL